MIEFKSRKFDIVCDALERAKKHEVTRVHVKPEDVHTWRTYICVRLEIERDILVRTVYFKETQTLYIIVQPKPKGGLLS